MNSIDSFNIANSITCDPEDCILHIKKPTNYHKILHQNIRSLNCNFNSFCTLLARLRFECDIIVLSECWLSHVSNLPILHGYNSYKTNNTYNQNDGLVVYVKNHTIYEVSEPEFVDANCLIIKLNENSILIAIYRPPSFQNLEIFLTSLHTVLLSLNSFKNIMLMGDININLLDTNSQTTAYLDTLCYHGLLPSSYTPTRANNCLDHIVLKTKSLAYSFTLNTSVTDHEAICLCLNKDMNQYVLPKNKVYQKTNFEMLLSECKQTNFEHILLENNLELAMDLFVATISKLILSNSLKIKLPRSKVTIKPWITTGLLRCIKNRDRMHKKIKLEPNNEILKTSYKRYRNYCNNLLKKIKKQYEKNQLLQAKNNSKKLWNTIKIVTNTTRSNSIPQELLSDKNTASSINAINTFFAKVGETLAKKISFIPPPLTATGPLPPNSFVLLPTDCEEVERIIQGLKSDCSPGWDNIGAGALKVISCVITPILTDLLNACIDKGIFPKALKKSIVHPIHKAGDRSCVDNYRPISILTTLSKVYERIVNLRLIKYLEKFNLLADAQYGFRTGRSTDDAIHEFTDFVVKKLDRNYKCLTIFLDLAKAFDTVSVPCLIVKLEELGIRGVPLALFSSYLTDRSQFVKIGNVVSDELSIEYGVPQGSILGPTLFLCYINKLCQLDLTNCRVSSYADDTALTFYSQSWEELFQVAQMGFATVCNWLAANSLTLNAKKTKYITFALKNKLAAHHSGSLIAHSCTFGSGAPCTCPEISRSNKIKYLGVDIDSNLAFRDHIHTISQRVRKLTYLFKHLRHIADKDTLKITYQALVESILSYCIKTWGGAPKTLLLQLERSQRMLLKVSLFKPKLYETAKLYADAGVLTVRQLYLLSTILYQHSRVDSTIVVNKKQNRRHYEVCIQQAVRTSFAQRFFYFRAPRLYNILNKKLNIANTSKFELKKKLFCHLNMLNYVDTENLIEVKR